MTDDAMEQTTLEILNYATYFGVDIDRDFNKSRGLHKFLKPKNDHI